MNTRNKTVPIYENTICHNNMNKFLSYINKFSLHADISASTLNPYGYSIILASKIGEVIVTKHFVA